MQGVSSRELDQERDKDGRKSPDEQLLQPGQEFIRPAPSGSHVVHPRGGEVEIEPPADGGAVGTCVPVIPAIAVSRAPGEKAAEGKPSHQGEAIGEDDGVGGRLAEEAAQESGLLKYYHRAA